MTTFLSKIVAVEGVWGDTEMSLHELSLRLEIPFNPPVHFGFMSARRHLDVSVHTMDIARELSRLSRSARGIGRHVYTEAARVIREGSYLAAHILLKGDLPATAREFVLAIERTFRIGLPPITTEKVARDYLERASQRLRTLLSVVIFGRILLEDFEKVSFVFPRLEYRDWEMTPRGEDFGRTVQNIPVKGETTALRIRGRRLLAAADDLFDRPRGFHPTARRFLSAYVDELEMYRLGGVGNRSSRSSIVGESTYDNEYPRIAHVRGSSRIREESLIPTFFHEVEHVRVTQDVLPLLDSGLLMARPLDRRFRRLLVRDEVVRIDRGKLKDPNTFSDLRCWLDQPSAEFTRRTIRISVRDLLSEFFARARELPIVVSDHDKEQVVDAVTVIGETILSSLELCGVMEKAVSNQMRHAVAVKTSS